MPMRWAALLQTQRCLGKGSTVLGTRAGEPSGEGYTLRVCGESGGHWGWVVHGLLTVHTPLSLPVLGPSVFWSETASLVGVRIQ